VERLGRADQAQIEQHLVPKTGVQQVQHRMLDTADVQVDAADRLALTRCIRAVMWGTRSHPVALHLGVDEGVAVRRVEIAQLVPARPGPLGHHVELAAVSLWAVAQVNLDVDPLLHPTERWHRVGVGVVGVVGLGRVVVHLGQLDGQL